MDTTRQRYFRDKLDDIAARLHRDAEAVSDQTRRTSGGQGAGEITNVPQHLGDMGTEEYLHDLNATLLENEEYLADEVRQAIERLDEGTFGICDACGQPIREERLEAIPYAQYCIGCAEQFEAGEIPNFDEGRPNSPAETLAYDGGVGESIPVHPETAPATPETEDVAHAVGTPGGGTALGGLAGTNQGDGSPDDEEIEELEEAMGSSEFDAEDARPPETDAEEVLS
jgi:RNA polymerase-binding transcription factor DksA